MKCCGNTSSVLGLYTDLQNDLLYGRFKKGSLGIAISLKSSTLKYAKLLLT